MQSTPITLPSAYGGAVDDDAPVEAAVARLPPPRSPNILLAKLTALGVEPDNVVVDLGCGHGQYAQQIATATACAVVALDQSAQYVAETRLLARQSDAARVHAGRAVAEALPLRPQSVDFIWCRDMLYHVELPRTLRECAVVLAPGGHMVMYQSFATELMEPLEARRLYVPTPNMDPAYFEACAEEAGFTIIECDKIGSEWREWAELEGSVITPGGGGLGAGLGTSAKLLRAARLVRGGEALRRELGEEAYEAALADCLWGLYQMIGKLCPTAYVLRRV